MSDDALHPDHETASAYLDGELEQDERALAEASPTTMGLVAAFAVVHDRLAAVPPASDTVRDQAIAAALAELDALRSPVAAAAFATPPPAAIPLFKRTGFRIASAAAAVLLVGVVGIAALNSGGQDDDSSSAELPSAERDASTADTSAPAEEAGDSAGGAPEVMSASTTIGAITGPAEAPPQLSSEDELLALARDLVATRADDGESTDASMAPADTTAGATDYDMPMSTQLVAACELSPTQVYVTDIIWIDTQAALVYDTDSGEALAMAADCTVLARATP